jgi:uncharacterized protein (TIGR03382 family)
MEGVRCSWVLSVGLVLATSAQAQMLSWAGLPATCQATPNGPLRVARTGSTASSLDVVVLASGGDWATDPSTLVWSNPLTVTIPAGQLTSAPLWLRCDDVGQVQVTATALGAASATGSVTSTPLFFADDFEGSRLLLTQNPQGAWAGVYTRYGTTVLSGSAHRGAGGLRSIDNDAISGHQLVTFVQQHVFPFRGDLYLRGWVRLVSSTEDDGLTFMKSEEPNFATGHWSISVFPGGVVAAELWQGDGGFVSVSSDAGALPTGAWVLLEADYRGAQTADAGLAVRVNGVTVAEVTHADARSSALACAGLSVGAFFNQDGRGRFVLDWDDLRFGTRPHPVRLQVDVPGPVVLGRCTPVQLSLRDASGALRGAPADLSLAVVGATMFAEGTCQTTFTPQLARGADSIGAFARFDSVVPVSLVVSHVDFLPGSAQVTPIVVPVDAGAFDAGAADAGPRDAGTSDGGTLQARLSVGCDCGEGPGPLMLVVGLAVFLVHRRRAA